MKKEQVLTDFDNVLEFKKPEARPALITGGPVAPENWLKDLNKGSVFLARQRNNKDLILNKYLLIEHKTSSTNLIWGTPDGRQLDVWVPTLEFSRQFDLNEVIAEVEFTYHEEEGADNASERMEQSTEERGVSPVQGETGGPEAG